MYTGPLQPCSRASSKMQVFKPATRYLRSCVRYNWTPGMPTVCRSATQTAAKPASGSIPDGKTVSRKDLSGKVAELYQLDMKDVDLVVMAFLNAIQETVADDCKVQLTGFGTFKRSERAARNGRNPATGAPLKVPATATPTFSAGKKFKDTVKDAYNTPANKKKK